MVENAVCDNHEKAATITQPKLDSAGDDKISRLDPVEQGEIHTAAPFSKTIVSALSRSMLCVVSHRIFTIIPCAYLVYIYREHYIIKPSIKKFKIIGGGLTKPKFFYLGLKF